MDALWQHFQYPYAWHVLIGAAAVGAVCSLLSVIVVLKRMAFIGQGISHAGFGGVGTAALLGYTAVEFRWQHDLIVFTFCLATAIVIGLLVRSKRVEADAAIGILLAGTMAWGVLTQNLRVELQDHEWYRRWVGVAVYNPPWESILFGSVFTMGAAGMWAAIVMCLAVAATCALLHKELLFFTFDESVSRVYGVRTRLMHYLLLTLLAVVVVMGIRLVGLILISALLILPGATAMLLSRRLNTVLALSVIGGVAASAGGLLLSLMIGTLSPGACIVMTLCAMFTLAYGGHMVGRTKRSAAKG